MFESFFLLEVIEYFLLLPLIILEMIDITQEHPIKPREKIGNLLGYHVCVGIVHHILVDDIMQSLIRLRKETFELFPDPE